MENYFAYGYDFKTSKFYRFKSAVQRDRWVTEDQVNRSYMLKRSVKNVTEWKINERDFWEGHP